MGREGWQHERALAVYPKGYRIASMCRATTCKQCGKTTWAGCGMHVDQVLAGVAESDRCAGHPAQQREGGLLSKLFHRS